MLTIPLLALLPGFAIPKRMKDARAAAAHEKLLKQTVGILLLWTSLTALVLTIPEVSRN